MSTRIQHALYTPVRRFSSLATASLSPKIKLSERELKQQWDRDGFILCKGLFDSDEMDILRDTIAVDTILAENEYAVKDGNNLESALVLWNRIGNDTYGKFMSSQRIVRTAELLLGGSVNHYHTKMMRKHPKTGGAFVWHQDYGYWYQNGVIFPHLLTAFIAIHPCTVDNGCLEVVKGSHTMGRLEHSFVGGQTGIHDSERMDYIQSQLETVQCLMQSGDTLFFHSNLLHKSNANYSNHPRWALLAAYNLQSNVPYKAHHHICTSINVESDEAIRQCGIKPINDTSVFLDPSTDKTVRNTIKSE